MTQPSNPLRAFKDRALTEFTREITDLFFGYIESHETLFPEYQRIIGRERDLDTTNRYLGAAVKEWFALRDLQENDSPKSRLIRSYTEHCR